MTRLFVYSLSWNTTSDGLLAYLKDENFAVESAQVIMDRESGKSKGYAFVEFANELAAQEALKAFQDGNLHLDGRKLGANVANQRPDRTERPSRTGRMVEGSEGGSGDKRQSGHRGKGKGGKDEYDWE